MAAELVSGGLFLREIRSGRVPSPVSENRRGPWPASFQSCRLAASSYKRHDGYCTAHHGVVP